jgi:hypothetical protein
MMRENGFMLLQCIWVVPILYGIPEKDGHERQLRAIPIFSKTVYLDSILMIHDMTHPKYRKESITACQNVLKREICGFQCWASFFVEFALWSKENPARICSVSDCSCICPFLLLNAEELPTQNGQFDSINNMNTEDSKKKLGQGSRGWHEIINKNHSVI